MKISIQESISRSIKFCFTRPILPLNILIPEIRQHHIQPSDRRYARNVDRFNDLVQRILTERRQGESSSYDESNDLLSILTSSDLFKNDDELIKNEVFTFFLAGMKTIQISTTNLIFYMNKHPEFKRKLLSEILPPIEAVKGDIVEGLTYDTVMEYEYLV